MLVADFKMYALRTLTEEHLWKVGESDEFTLLGYKYAIEKLSDVCWSLTYKTINRRETFSTMNRLFHHLFEKHGIRV